MKDIYIDNVERIRQTEQNLNIHSDVIVYPSTDWSWILLQLHFLVSCFSYIKSFV